MLVGAFDPPVPLGVDLVVLAAFTVAGDFVLVGVDTDLVVVVGVLTTLTVARGGVGSITARTLSAPGVGVPVHCQPSSKSAQA